MLAPGTKAPDFELFSGIDEKVNLYQFQGRRVVLVFYPADWSPVCGDQLIIYNETLEIFSRYNAVVLGISVDGKWCHSSYREQRNLEFPLLADFEPKGAVAKTFGVYDDKAGTAKRALYVIDENSIVRWNYISPIDINPGADGILSALEKLSS
jgi:peroxiredoxin